MTGFDYCVLGIYLTSIFLLGWRLRVGQGKHDDFFLASRSMGWFPIGLSVMVTVFSVINYLAFPNEVFGYGLYIVAALPVFFLAAWPVTRIWMPFFHEMKLTSVYEYLEYRFDVRVRSLASGIFILWRLFWMATALYASAQIMSILSGLSPWLIMLIAGIAATAYTWLGGMRVVMWTDVLQFFVLFGGIALGVWFALGDGGIGELLRIAHDGNRLAPFSPFDPAFLSPDPRIRMTLWSGLIGVFVAFLSRYGADQVVMQRYFSAKSLAVAQRGLWLNATASVISLSLLLVFGLAIYANAVKTGALQDISWDTLTPLHRKGIALKQLAALIKRFPPGMTGMVIAGLFAATMSSIDSGINACSAAFVTDFHKRFSTRHRSTSLNEMAMDKGLTLAIGTITIVMGLALIPLVGKTNSLFMIVNKLINGLGSPLLALFLLGMFTRFANATGVFYGGILGVMTSLMVSLTVRPLALQYYSVLNLLVTLIPCCVFSIIFNYLNKENPPDNKTRWTWLEWRKNQ